MALIAGAYARETGAAFSRPKFAREGDGGGRVVLQKQPSSLEIFLLYLTVITFFMISGDLLQIVGYDYKGDTGSVITHFHPATWILSLLLVIAAMRAGNPIRYFEVFGRDPLIAAALSLFLFTTAWAAIFVHTPVTPMLETFVVPMFAFVLVAGQAETTKRNLAMLVHALLALNGCIAIVERLLGYGFVGDLYALPDFRASALLGHPLSNAMITGLYVIACASGGARDLPALLRVPAILLQIVALGVFGGRSALGVTMALLVVISAVQALRLLFVPLTRAQILMFLIGVPVLVGAMAALYFAGLFDPLIARSLDDVGSTRARLVLPNLVSQVTWTELMFGPDQLNLRRLTLLEGTEYGIESFWIGSLLLYGFLGAIPLWIGCGIYSAALLRVSRWGTIPLLVGFWLIASTANSIATKGLFLLFLQVMVQCLLRPLSPPRAMPNMPRGLARAHAPRVQRAG